MKHTIAKCILIMQTLLISCHAWNGIIVESSVAKGGAQLIQPNQVTHVDSVNFNLPNIRAGEAVTLPNGHVYFLGGTTTGGAGGATNTVKRFDPATNTSTIASSMNSARYV